MQVGLEIEVVLLIVGSAPGDRFGKDMGVVGNLIRYKVGC